MPIQNITWVKSPFRTRKFRMQPFLLVIHRAEKLVGVAEYLLGKDAKEREVSCHFAYSAKHDDFVQMVETTHRACHAGYSTYQNRTGCNDFSIGIELPGPMHTPISDAVMIKLDKLTDKLLMGAKGITDCCGHCHVAPGRRTDPGPEFNFKQFCQKHNLRFIF